MSFPLHCVPVTVSGSFSLLVLSRGLEPCVSYECSPYSSRLAVHPVLLVRGVKGCQEALLVTLPNSKDFYQSTFSLFF